MDDVQTLIHVLVIFCSFFFQEKAYKCSNNYRSSFIHINAFMNALRFMCHLRVDERSSDSYIGRDDFYISF